MLSIVSAFKGKRTLHIAAVFRCNFVNGHLANAHIARHLTGTLCCLRLRVGKDSRTGWRLGLY